MFRRLGDSLRRFMWGRYGSDQLNMFLLVASAVFCILGGILSRFGTVCTIIAMAMNLLTYGLLIFALFRMLSRNLDKRRQENQRFLRSWSRLKDRKNRYYHCPNCKQTVRVPRGRGKICIRCPKCSEKFIRKS